MLLGAELGIYYCFHFWYRCTLSWPEATESSKLGRRLGKTSSLNAPFHGVYRHFKPDIEFERVPAPFHGMYRQAVVAALQHKVLLAHILR